MTPLDVPPAAIALPVLQGHREIAALWLPDEWYDEASRRRLVLQAWSPSCTLRRFVDGDLLQFARPLVGDCATLPGWPLWRVSGVLCSADVAPAQLAGVTTADVLLAVGAAWRALTFADAAPVDPATWLDVSIGFVDMADCRLPAAQRVLVAPTARALREVLGPDVPAAPSAETAALLQALERRSRRAQAEDATVRSGPSGGDFDPPGTGTAWKVAAVVAVVVVIVALIVPHGGDASGSTGSDSGSGSLAPPGLLGAFAWLAFFLMRRLGRGGSPSAGRGTANGVRAGTAAAGAGAARPREGVRARANRALRTLPARAERVLPQRWRNWAARLAMTAGIANLLGAQHSAYLRRMLRLFEEGQIDDALRHAIPLDGDGGSLGQAFGRLTARDQLQLRGTRGASTGIGLDVDLQAHLRKLYRRSFELLDRQGRIDEAVFVLAELLNARQEALDYLEKHGRHAQAAELALGWDMPAAQIVRLHALAGDWRTAVLVARRDNAFEAAITLLDKRWPDAAMQLRREWAESLVARGLRLEAVHVAWPLESERGRAAEWLDVAEAGGGALAARALALRAHWLPDTLPARAAHIAALCDEPASVQERTALALELLRLPAPPSPAARRLAALLAGAVVADLAMTGPPAAIDQAAAKRLVDLAGDAALSADMPGTGWPGRAPVALHVNAGTVGWFAPAAGTHAVVDVAALPDGEFLVALGEAGAVRIDARGQWRARFPVPAQSLVIAHDGRSALALARRERVWRVSRLDLARGRAEDLGMHAFDAFARSFDGIGWTIAIDRRVQVLDTTRGLSEALWQVGDLPGCVTLIDVQPNRECWLIRTETAVEQWFYELPARRLSSRGPLPEQAPDGGHRMLAGGVGVIEFDRAEPGDRTRARRFASGPPSAPLPWHGVEALLVADEQWLLLREPATDEAAEQAIALVNFNTGRVHGRWFWPCEARVRARLQGDTWLLFDDQGRVSAVSTATSQAGSVSVR